MPLLSSEELAQTYRPPTERNAWEQVQLYHQSQRYPDDWGAARVASAINADDEVPFETLSRSNLRAWVDGDGMPDAARAVTVAEDLGWVATEWTPTVRAFAELVIGVYACGSIATDTWVPTWAPDSGVGRETIVAGLERIGVGCKAITRTEKSDGKRRADELRPRQHASILGRALHVAGAALGDKNLKSTAGLPEWLATAPPSVRGSAAELLVRERAIVYPEKATRRIQSERHPQYFTDVAALIEDVTGESVTASDSGVTISADAVRALGLA